MASTAPAPVSGLLIVVPARGGSKRLPGKNLRPLAGRSLLEWTARHVSASGLNAPCLLTTDDMAIAQAGEAVGFLVPFLRPPILARDETPTFPAVLHALDWYADTHREPDNVLLLQVTSPLRDPACLNEAVAQLADRPDADAVIAMCACTSPGSGVSGHLYIVRDDGLLRQTDPDNDGQFLTPNGALYLVRTSALRERQTLFPPCILPLVMDATASIDIDTQEDWDRAEAAIAAAGVAAQDARSAL